MPKHILHIRERMGSLVYIKVPTAKVCLAVEGCGVLNLIISRLSCAGLECFGFTVVKVVFQVYGACGCGWLRASGL